MIKTTANIIYNYIKLNKYQLHTIVGIIVPTLNKNKLFHYSTKRVNSIKF